MSELQTTARRAVRLSAPVASVAAPRVLVADGNVDSRAIRESQLSAAGFRVSVARTPFEAIVKASCQLPDLILLDASVGGRDIDTAEISRLLTTCPVTAHIPVVRLTPGRRLPQRLLTDLRRRAIE